MRVKWTAVLVAGALLPFVAAAATFGTVVQVHGAIADIAIDETRGNLYAANFAAYRVEVIKTSTGTLSSSISTPAPPSAVAVSPDAHYLVIGLYQTPLNTVLGGYQLNTGGVMIVDLTTSGSGRAQTIFASTIRCISRLRQRCEGAGRRHQLVPGAYGPGNRTYSC